MGKTTNIPKETLIRIFSDLLDGVAGTAWSSGFHSLGDNAEVIENYEQMERRFKEALKKLYIEALGEEENGAIYKGTSD